MRWIWLIAIAGCSGTTDKGDAKPGDDTAALGVVQAAFVGYAYWTPAYVPGQDPDWCQTMYAPADTGDTGDTVTCTQSVSIVSNGNVMWTHYVEHLDGTVDIVEVLPYGTWSDVGPYENLVGGHKYQVDGKVWTVWPSQASNWDVPDSERTVLAGGQMMAFPPVID